jgi:hypothetical protein
MTSSTRIALRGLAGLALGAVLATSGSVGTVLGARPTPAIVAARCTTPLYEGAGDANTSVSWEGVRPSHVVFEWSDSYFIWTADVVRPKGTGLTVPTPVDGYALELLSGNVTVYGPHGIQLQRSFQCYQGY